MRKLHLALEGDIVAGMPVCAIRGAALYDLTNDPQKVTCYHCKSRCGLDPYAKTVSQKRDAEPER